MAQGRSLLREIFNNFIKSLKPKKYWGELKGTDYMGTDYYEDPSSGKGKRCSRWFVPSDPLNFDQEIPPEWMAWLTYKRNEPPTEEEINLNLQKMKNTIEKAKKLEESRTLSKDELGMFKKPEYPKHKEFDLELNINQKRKDQQ